MDDEGQAPALSILEGLLTFLSDILDGDPQPLECYTRRFRTRSPTASPTAR